MEGLRNPPNRHHQALIERIPPCFFSHELTPNLSPTLLVHQTETNRRSAFPMTCSPPASIEEQAWCPGYFPRAPKTFVSPARTVRLWEKAVAQPATIYVVAGMGNHLPCEGTNHSYMHKHLSGQARPRHSGSAGTTGVGYLSPDFTYDGYRPPFRLRRNGA